MKNGNFLYEVVYLYYESEWTAIHRWIVIFFYCLRLSTVHFFESKSKQYIIIMYNSKEKWKILISIL